MILHGSPLNILVSYVVGMGLLVAPALYFQRGNHSPMKVPSIDKVTTIAQARNIAIDWQNWASKQSLSFSELANWQAYFRSLARKYPELREEFEENAIL